MAPRAHRVHRNDTVSFPWTLVTVALLAIVVIFFLRTKIGSAPTKAQPVVVQTKAADPAPKEALPAYQKPVVPTAQPAPKVTPTTPVATPKVEKPQEVASVSANPAPTTVTATTAPAAVDKKPTPPAEKPNVVNEPRTISFVEDMQPGDSGWIMPDTILVEDDGTCIVDTEEDLVSETFFDTRYKEKAAPFHCLASGNGEVVYRIDMVGNDFMFGRMPGVKQTCLVRRLTDSTRSRSLNRNPMRKYVKVQVILPAEGRFNDPKKQNKPGIAYVKGLSFVWDKLPPDEVHGRLYEVSVDITPKIFYVQDGYLHFSPDPIDTGHQGGQKLEFRAFVDAWAPYTNIPLPGFFALKFREERVAFLDTGYCCTVALPETKSKWDTPTGLNECFTWEKNLILYFSHSGRTMKSRAYITVVSFKDGFRPTGEAVSPELQPRSAKGRAKPGEK